MADPQLLAKQFFYLLSLFFCFHARRQAAKADWAEPFFSYRLDFTTFFCETPPPPLWDSGKSKEGQADNPSVKDTINNHRQQVFSYIHFHG
jgi:hypothetical protein